MMWQRFTDALFGRQPAPAVRSQFAPRSEYPEFVAKHSQLGWVGPREVLAVGSNSCVRVGDWDQGELWVQVRAVKDGRRYHATAFIGEEEAKALHSYLGARLGR